MNFDAETEETILRYFPMDRIEAIQVQPYSFVVPGNKNCDITLVHL
jgi:hypothetical protein